MMMMSAFPLNSEGRHVLPLPAHQQQQQQQPIAVPELLSGLSGMPACTPTPSSTNTVSHTAYPVIQKVSIFHHNMCFVVHKVPGNSTLYHKNKSRLTDIDPLLFFI